MSKWRGSTANSRRAVALPSSTKASPALTAGLFSWLSELRIGHALIAVSGGSDSMALLVAAASSKGPRVSAASVDHGLRAGSADEAGFVAAAAARLGVPHQTLRWLGAKPQSGIQAAARAARYTLLVDHAHRIGADAILVAHTMDDQAETVLMRMARSHAPRALAAMARDTQIAAGASAPVRLLRPFLAMRRAALRQFLADAGEPYIDDPGNQNAAFERVRVRRRLADRDAAGEGEVLRLAALADAMRREAERIAAEEDARFAALGGRFDAFGAAILGAPFAAIPGAAFAAGDSALLARLVAAVSGTDEPPGENDGARALEAFLRTGKATLAGALVEREGAGAIIRREPAAVFGRRDGAPAAPRIDAPAGGALIFDRRFIAENRLGRPAILRGLTRAEARALLLPPSAEGAPAFILAGEIAAFAGEDGAFTPLAAEKYARRVNRFH